MKIYRNILEGFEGSEIFPKIVKIVDQRVLMTNLVPDLQNLRKLSYFKVNIESNKKSLNQTFYSVAGGYNYEIKTVEGSNGKVELNPFKFL